ncbi:MAG TPA: hypothetical protein DCP32_02275 [Anaerolineaceae bacterium]|nr:MAG: hypothetical protein A2X24_00325 [Chloroflexi bacterium GWB2_54_36]HAL15604.1 hypothetical protein [Anaerolineaceae bacterium]HBA92237.1 hypothetical protein [Anaerolineaceae bacterium]
MIPVGSQEEQGIKKKTVMRENYWNALTIVALLTTLAVVVLLLVIFNNPAAGVNPYPPPAKVGEIVPLSASETPTSLPPTWTPTSEPTLPAIDPPTAVPSPTTAVLIVAGTPATAQSPSPTSETAKPGKFAFGLQAQPQGISASLYEPTRGCAWMGVAGRVFDIQNRPVKGIRVAINGWLGNRTIKLLSLTGTALQYGLSGYEFTLADAPRATVGQLTIQLFDQSDLPLSDLIVLDTYAECEKNLILVDFKQVNE